MAIEAVVLGSSGIEVSRLGFGCFGIAGNRSGNSYGPTDDKTSIAAVHEALDLGCTFFDTADVYGHGHGERLLGRALRNRDGAVVATKVGGRFDSGTTVADHSAEHILASIDASLRRLGRDHVDVYQLHDPPLAAIRAGEAFDALDELVRLGKIRCYGASIHTLEEGRACLDREGLACLQVRYNLLSMLEPQSAMDQLFESCLRRGVGVIAREPLAAGFLSGRHDDDTVYGVGDIRGQWPAGLRRLHVALADSLRHLAGGGVTMAQAALRFVLDQAGVSTVIVGIKTPAQAREDLAVCDLPPFEELAAGAPLGSGAGPTSGAAGRPATAGEQA